MYIFGYEQIFRSAQEVADLIDVIKYFRDLVQKPLIMQTGRGREVFSAIWIAKDPRLVGPRMMDWLYDQEKYRVEKPDMVKVMLACSDEDREWSARRNKGLAFLAYRKITFLPEIQDKLIKEIDGYLDELAEELAYRTEWEATKERERKARYDKWTKSAIYEYRAPKAGEDGQSGYLDAEYISNETGRSVRMVNRDLFDIGCDWYPKRLEGSQDAFNRVVWTDDEFKLDEWMREFADFRGIRM